MEVRVGNLLTDEARGVQRLVEVSLDEQDAKLLFKEGWDELDVPKKFDKLSAMADILMHGYAMQRGLRDQETTYKDIQGLVSKYLS